MSLTCCVQNCSNGAYWLNKWKKELCEACGCVHKDRECNCPPPFRLFTFPTKKKDAESRERWKQLVGRRQGNKVWSPGKDSRVCSKHFVEGEPTRQNPWPTLCMGYDGAEKRSKRMEQFQATSTKPTRKRRRLEEDHIDMLIATPFHADPDVETLPKTQPEVPWIFTLMALLVMFYIRIWEQTKEIKRLKEDVFKKNQEILKLRKKVYSDDIMKTDDDVNFYTGLRNKSLFNKFHDYIAPFVNRRWTGVVSMVKNVRKFKTAPRFGPSRKLSSKSEFLLMLMKLRLGLLNHDLATRFDISVTLVSRIFFAWLRSASTVLQATVYLPDEEELIASKPQRFRKFPDLHSIIDCTELFIETPKDLYLQSATWSDYKHHNTLKLLVACAPNSKVIFVSKVYLGRVSDKAITLDCGFLNKVPKLKMIMADKGFNIANECADRQISLHVPPGRRGKSQMTSANVAKTKRIANHRILIEQVIRRLKTFRILANEMVLSLVPHIDDIVVVCAALSNLKDPIYSN